MNDSAASLSSSCPFRRFLRACAFLTVLLLVLALVPAAPAASTLVSNVTGIATALAGARPGDIVLLQDGVWRDADILFSGQGTEASPITLRAQTPGQVFLSGLSRLRIAGRHLVVEGLVFTNGYRTLGDVIAFQDTASSQATNCRLSHCAIVNYNPPSSASNTKWVSLYGVSNRVENCYFRGKNNVGTTLVVWVATQPDQPNHHRIARNHFGLRPSIGTDGETLRVGTSDVSLNLSRTLVEENLFEQCNGELETISNKSCENVYRHNTFLECEGTLTLRHGNRCTVEANYFLGRLRSRTGGVRIIGEDHRVFNNYFAELTGSDGRSALTFQQGVVNSPLNGYFQVKRALVAFNTFVRCQNNWLIGLSDTPSGSSQPGTLPPVDCVIANNLVYGTSGQLIVQRIAPVTTLWEGNILFGTTLGVATNAGLWQVDPALALGADGLWRPGSNSPALGAAPGTYPVVTGDMEGHARPAAKDIGGDQISTAPVARPPLTAADVGPDWTRPAPAAPSILLQPASQSADAGGTVQFQVVAAGSAPLGYRWWANETALADDGSVSGAATATLTLTNVQLAQAGAYRVVVSNTVGSAQSSNALLMVNPVLSLPEALDDLERVWTTGGSVPWAGQTVTTYDGVDAARSGSTGHSQESWIQTTVVGPGALSFWWKVSCETNNDRLELNMDGARQLGITGEVDWQRRTFSVPAGSHTLQWRYSKNSSGISGQDRGWLDVVHLSPVATTITRQPSTQPVEAVVTVHSNVLLKVDMVPSLPEALDNPGRNWTMGGSVPWEGQTAVTHDRIDAARSGAIGHGEESWFQTTVTGPGALSFWWKVSCETNNDRLRLYLDGSGQMSISGQVDWQRRTLNLTTGDHTLRWRYFKNSSGIAGADRAWVDQIEFVPSGPTPPAIVTEPLSQTAGEGALVQLSVGASGTAPLTYRWRFNGMDLFDGTNVSGATGATLVLSNLPPARAGQYSVVVSNQLGNVRSGEAMLTVAPTLAEGLEAPLQVFSMGGDASWMAQTNETHDGVDAARSGRIGHSQNTRLETYVDGPGTVSFWWKISSEPLNDQLRFYVADVEQTRISGELDWEFRSFSVPAGSRVLLKWRYSKNSSSTQGQDGAWVDEIRFEPTSPAPAAAAAPLVLGIRLEGDTIVLRWNARAGKRYRVAHKDHLAETDWRVGDTDLPANGTNSTLEAAVQGGAQRFYRVVEQ